MSTETESFFSPIFSDFSTVSRPTLGIRLYFITTILTVHTARTLRVKPHRALSTRARASNSQTDADDCLLQAGWLSFCWKRFKTATVQWAVTSSMSRSARAIKLPHYYAVCLCRVHTRDACALHAGFLQDACSLLRPAASCITSYAGCIRA